MTGSYKKFFSIIRYNTLINPKDKILAEKSSKIKPLDLIKKIEFFLKKNLEYLERQKKIKKIFFYNLTNLHAHRKT